MQTDHLFVLFCLKYGPASEAVPIFWSHYRKGCM
jgi:hypothetical protein